ncbi:hypothetical protein, conserved in T. vivax [Trypanosoma vivax Y486]|uniref:Uncharacterized protein n=1 Tax=Trypanosoma vivax (strain Y486) TaxID=1055687 RepID=F9WQ53_TRYVY|nr:hypothetical protein, conserved in T. vivax [Trypanosoma vivax Y486]|eukprot:CCD19680.1 hypothetical protein, conserved in T. vivax [Trypanosoma vivax Y486]
MGKTKQKHSEETGRKVKLAKGLDRGNAGTRHTHWPRTAHQLGAKSKVTQTRPRRKAQQGVAPQGTARRRAARHSEASRRTAQQETQNTKNTENTQNTKNTKNSQTSKATDAPTREARQTHATQAQHRGEQKTRACHRIGEDIDKRNP